MLWGKTVASKERETDPQERGAEAPDWFYVPNVPPTLGNQIRRSYVLWWEFMAPMITLEFALTDGSSEGDTTAVSYLEVGSAPRPGKFCVYERIVRIPYYGIYEIGSGRLEVYNLNNGFYQQLLPNSRGPACDRANRRRVRTVAGQLSKPDNAMAAVVGHRGQFAADRYTTSL